MEISSSTIKQYAGYADQIKSELDDLRLRERNKPKGDTSNRNARDERPFKNDAWNERPFNSRNTWDSRADTPREPGNNSSETTAQKEEFYQSQLGQLRQATYSGLVDKYSKDIDETIGAVRGLAEQATATVGAISNEMEAQREADALNERLGKIYYEGKSYKMPSKFKYGLLFLLAVICDIIGILGYAFGWTGVALVIAEIVCGFISVSIFLIFWFTNQKQKSAASYQDKLKKELEYAEKNMAHIERRIVQVTRFLSKRKFVKESQRLTKMAASVEKTIARSPGSKLIGQAIGKLALLPISCICVYLSYRDERETYRDAAKAADRVFEVAPAMA